MNNEPAKPISRRALFRLVGSVAGSAVMYHAMAELGYASESSYDGPIRLEGNSKGASVLVLGAGLAGMCAALELRNAGYKVKILEYNDRAGGRAWSIRGGDTVTELGGARQECHFDPGLYFNPGPWRIPNHHRGLLDYCRRLDVPLETFTPVNYNAYVHSTGAFDGKPRRYREVQADFNGHVAELLAKATCQGKLDDAVTREDQEVLLEAMRGWGALDNRYEYKKGLITSGRRGFALDPGGGLMPPPVMSDPIPMGDLLQAQVWRAIAAGHAYDYQSTIFQPIGGMGRISDAFKARLADLIEYNCKVTAIRQDERGVTATYCDARSGESTRSASADWCVCTIPASILGQMEMSVGAPLKSAIDALSYRSSFKGALQFKRRFWEEDDSIFGGVSYTDQSISLIGYPSTGFLQKGKAVLLGAYMIGTRAYQWTAMTPEDRIRTMVEQGARIHPQYAAEFDSGISVGWHRIPWTLGCFAAWSDELRAKHYDNLCSFDGRIVLAGEHASRLPAWMEGAILSALDAVRRLHERVVTS